MAPIFVANGGEKARMPSVLDLSRESRWKLTRAQDSRSLDIVLVGVALVLLLALGIATNRPILESIQRSRLTLLSLSLAGFMLLAVLLREGQRSARKFVFDWIPIVALFAVYENLKHLHANYITLWLRILPKDRNMADIDQMLFGAVLPLRLEAISPSWLLQIMWFFYIWVYYCCPALLLAWAYFVLRDRGLFAELRHALVIGLLGGYVCYLLVPVAGPLFTYGDQFKAPIITHPVVRNLVFNYRYNWDCFPSLHTAIPWLLCFVAWIRLGIRGKVVCVLAACGVTCSTVFLRLHYGIDVIAGLVWAGLVFCIIAAARRNRTAAAPAGALCE